MIRNKRLMNDSHSHAKYPCVENEFFQSPVAVGSWEVEDCLDRF